MKNEQNQNEILHSAYAKCLAIAKSHYENFPVATFILSKQERHYFSAIYTYARIADDIADEGEMTVEKRLDMLNHMEQQLKECYEGEPQELIFIALKDTIEACHIPIELFLNLLHAFKIDLTIHHYQTFPQLLTHYCKYSADPMGRLVLSIFKLNHSEWQRYSDHICTALQLTNFWQDISVDLAKGRIYIPQEELAAFHVTEETLRKKIYSENFEKLMENLISRTESLFIAGKPILKIPNFKLRLYLWMTYHGGMEVLAKIRKQHYHVLSERIALNKFEKFKIFLRSLSNLLF